MAAKKKKTKLREPNVRPVEQEETIALPDPKKKPLKAMVKKATGTHNTIVSEKINQKILGTEEKEHAQRQPSRADLLAGDKFPTLNWYYPGGTEAFPVNPELRRVDKFYKYAHGGPLLVDETEVPERAEFYIKKKAPVMEHLGFKYAVILRSEVMHVVDGSGQ